MSDIPQTMNETHIDSSTTLLLGHPGDWWDFWMIVSLAVAAFAAFSTVVFTAGSVIVHKREASTASDELERYKAATAGKVAEATSAGIAAGERAGHAQADVDAAKVELARQTTLTAEAQLETERLKKQLAWRTISEDQATKFISAIHGAPPPGLKVTITAIVGDAEGAQYAESVAELLRKIGLSVDPPGASMYVGLLPEGLIMRIRDERSLGGKAATVLQHAFKLAGIEAPGALDSSMTDDSIQIAVGIKPHLRTRSK